jgi:hypothetical protein
MFFGTDGRSSVTQTAACPASGLSCEPNALVVLVKTKLRTPAAMASPRWPALPVTRSLQIPTSRQRRGEARSVPGWLDALEKIGAGEGARTLDPDLGKVVLYH